MKNLIEKVSEQLARVGRVRSIHDFSPNNTTPEIMEMTNSGHHQIQG
ncbi:hypothetical protein ZORO111903_00750 [Zobellia roscoffensis]